MKTPGLLGPIWCGLLAMSAAAMPLETRAQVQVLGPSETPAARDELESDLACGTREFTIAQMAWPSAAILAHIHAGLLEREFDCTVRITTGDPAATLSSMATTRQPAVAPELWISRHADIWNGAINARAVRAAGDSFSGGAIEAWFVPDYVRSNHPGLDDVGELMDYWRVFARDEAEQALLISCPGDWACAIINRGLVGALGLSSRFSVTEPADRFELDGLIADAVARREPVLTYYWQPNALIDQLNLVPLEMGGFDSAAAQCLAIADCVPFGPSAFAPDEVVIAAAEWVFVDAPEIAAYFERAAMPFSEMNALLAWQAETDADPAAVAARFIASRGAVWRAWIGTAGQETIEQESGEDPDSAQSPG